MLTLAKQTVTLYVDRTSKQWIARDCDGSFWLIPPFEDGWEHREPLELSEDMQLEPVPGHYRYMFGIPLY